MKRRLMVLTALPLLAACQQPAPGATGTVVATSPSAAATTSSAGPTSASPSPTQLRPSSPASTSPTASAATAAPLPSGNPVSDQDLAIMNEAAGFIERYWSVVDDMRNAGGTAETAAKLSSVATGDALRYWQDTAKAWSDNGVYSEGRYVVVYADQKTMAIGGGNGTATFQYCVDASRAEFKNRDSQGPVPSRPPERYRTGTATITYVDGGWKYTDAKEKPSNSC